MLSLTMKSMTHHVNQKQRTLGLYCREVIRDHEEEREGGKDMVDDSSPLQECRQRESGRTAYHFGGKRGQVKLIISVFMLYLFSACPLINLSKNAFPFPFHSLLSLSPCSQSRDKRGEG